MLARAVRWGHMVDEVGRDACRFYFLMRRSDSQLDFDLELAKRQSTDNPVYYVQYAHARVCSIYRNAEEQGVSAPEQGTVDLSRLALSEELLLAKQLAKYPETIIGAAQNCEPHRIVYYLQDLAAQFHSYYNRERVLVDDPATTQARLYLIGSVRTVLPHRLVCPSAAGASWLGRGALCVGQGGCRSAREVCPPVAPTPRAQTLAPRCR